MKTKSRGFRAWHSGAICGMAPMVLVVVSVALPAQRPPGTTVEFKSGKFEAKVAESNCSADLGTPGSDLRYMPGNVLMFGAHYSEKNCQIRLALMGVKGPGTYGKANIFNLSMNWGAVQNVWNFNRQKDDCTFTFTKLDEGGVQGKVACTGTGPLTAGTFSAAP